MAYNPAKDTGLTLLNSDNLFEEIVTRIAVRHGRYLRGFAYRFIELCSPKLSESIVRSALQLAQDSDDIR
jgi:LysR family transcriptional regulator, cys regulon transcriptional activator